MSGPGLIQQAFALAEEAHRGQLWKDGKHPYLFHPMSVSALVLRFGGDEAQAAAALLHDAGLPREKLPPEVVSLVEAFADPEMPEGTKDWAAIRQHYIHKLKSLGRRELLVIGCEELHEMSELLEELRLTPSSEIWARYPTPRHNVGWYFREILGVLNTAIGRAQPTKDESALLAAFAVRVRDVVGVTFEG